MRRIDIAPGYPGDVGPLCRHAIAWQSAADLIITRASPVADLAGRQGLVIRRDQARQAGIPDAEVRRRLRRAEWISPRHGTLCPLGPADDGLPPLDGPELIATAAVLVHRRMVISHDCSVALHGLPLLHTIERPVLTGPSDSRSCSWHHIRVHAAAMTRGEVTTWFGAPVTSVARSIIDHARDRGVADGLVAADAALHEGATTLAELSRLLERQRGWPGVRAARRVLELADGRSESPLETLTRLCIADAGLPVPDLQVDVIADGARYRVDMMWPSVGLILEADGMDKYRGDFAVLAREKRRQERLENAGYRVIRVSWDDVVRRPAETAQRIRAALAAAAARA